MEIEYSSEKTRDQCNSVAAAKKLFGGDQGLVLKLMSKIQALESAVNIKDIIVQKQFRFHNLEDKGKNSLDGYFAIDVKTIREPWRIILRPLKEDKTPYIPCDIDKIADEVTVIEIREVSKHYE